MRKGKDGEKRTRGWREEEERGGVVEERGLKVLGSGKEGCEEGMK